MAVTVPGAGEVLFRSQNKIDLHKDGSLMGTYSTIGGPIYLITVTDCGEGKIETFEIWYGRWEEDD